MAARDLEYEQNNIGFDYQYPEEDGGGIKCKNWEACQAVLPTWWFECKGRYFCTNCDMLFGAFSGGKGLLQFHDNLECPVCLEVKRSVSQPRCEHTVCLDCFRRCHYGDESGEGEPQFPYPEIEDEYYDDTKNPKWAINYPLINTYNAEWNAWEDKREAKRDVEESYIRLCPICRQ
jgi:hypothetical protein